MELAHLRRGGLWITCPGAEQAPGDAPVPERVAGSRRDAAGHRVGVEGYADLPGTGLRLDTEQTRGDELPVVLGDAVDSYAETVAAYAAGIFDALGQLGSGQAAAGAGTGLGACVEYPDVLAHRGGAYRTGP